MPGAARRHRAREDGSSRRRRLGGSTAPPSRRPSRLRPSTRRCRGWSWPERYVSLAGVLNVRSPDGSDKSNTSHTCRSRRVQSGHGLGAPVGPVLGPSGTHGKVTSKVRARSHGSLVFEPAAFDGPVCQRELGHGRRVHEERAACESPTTTTRRGRGACGTVVAARRGIVAVGGGTCRSATASGLLAALAWSTSTSSDAVRTRTIAFPSAKATTTATAIHATVRRRGIALRSLAVSSAKPEMRLDEPEGDVGEHDCYRDAENEQSEPAEGNVVWPEYLEHRPVPEVQRVRTYADPHQEWSRQHALQPAVPPRAHACCNNHGCQSCDDEKPTAVEREGVRVDAPHDARECEKTRERREIECDILRFESPRAPWGPAQRERSADQEPGAVRIGAVVDAAGVRVGRVEHGHPDRRPSAAPNTTGRSPRRRPRTRRSPTSNRTGQSR